MDAASGNLSLTGDTKKTFDRWYNDQMTSSHADNAPDNDDNDCHHHHHELTPSSAASRLSNGHVRVGGHGRTWFDPVSELPRLQRWLRHNSHPTRAEMAIYAHELNAGSHRQAAQRPLDVNNIAYWFKNARARALTRLSRRSASPTDDLTADTGVELAAERVPELPNSNAVYVVSPLLPPRSTAADDDSLRHSRKRRRSCESSDENHNQRCTSSLSSASSVSDVAAAGGVPAAGGGLTADDDVVDGATDLSVRRTRSASSSSLSVQSDEPIKTDDDRTLTATTTPVPLHPALASTGLAPLSLPLHVQQALQQHVHLAMRYVHQPLYPTAPAQHWLPWLSASAQPEPDDDSSTGGGPVATESGEVRRKRSRVFIDPLSEIPRLEQWFAVDSHPSSSAIERLTDELNRSAYRQRFPPLEPKNVQLWFKNHRAKVKRLSVETPDDVKMMMTPSNHYTDDVTLTRRDAAVS